MEWKPIKNYDGLYEVSDAGEIRSVDRFVKTGIKYNESRLVKSKPLKPRKKSNGYLTVDLCKDGKVTTTLVHRLVAEAFVPNPLNKYYVNHIDSNRENNSVANLEWVTSSENRRHGMEYGNVVFRQTRKVTCADNGLIFEQAKIAAQWLLDNYGERTRGDISTVANNIRRACKGFTPKAYGFTWKYHEGSTTIPKGSTRKRVEMGGNLEKG